MKNAIKKNLLFGFAVLITSSLGISLSHGGNTFCPKAEDIKWMVVNRDLRGGEIHGYLANTSGAMVIPVWTPKLDNKNDVDWSNRTVKARFEGDQRGGKITCSYVKPGESSGINLSGQTISFTSRFSCSVSSDGTSFDCQGW